ncbi:AbrB/MazE/SpoVT family DNA-binding domain-containing protein [Candidatus Woesearchaeota archaeon]|nr:AbrB/MazE/SpoVT family DNA-binding domain-containing protein [Candidatus Woesearchaeota archaeon]
MYKTKITKKGQITVPNEYREKLDLSRGSVVEVGLRNKQILIQKPKSDLEDLFGAWSDVTDKQVKQIKSIWRGWNEKNIRRL